MKEILFDRNNFDENGIKIDSVSSFIDEVNQIRESQEGNSTEIFFRGQKANFWDIKPSIFREDFLGNEHVLMNTPLLRTPYEFMGIDNNFEIMTKYQHYGMCTRLLDITSNPLVALYFACEQYGKVEYKESGDNANKFESEAYGIVFYNMEYPVTAQELPVKIISELSFYDLSQGNSLSSVLEYLEGKKVITKKEKDHWLTFEGYKFFVDYIQGDYVISPSYSNERLLRQNGMFLLSGCFNFNYAQNICESTIEKGYGDLRRSFSERFFYIEGDNKKNILEELDTYNINEATLFPELEHQLNYIKKKKKQGNRSAAEFIKYENETSVGETVNNYYSIKDDVFNNTVFWDELSNKIKKMVSVAKDDIIEAIKGYVSYVDWYNKPSIQSKMKIDLKKVLSKYDYDKEKIEEKVNDILETVISEAEEASK